jgi:ATP-dependent Clp protease protease subunit
MTRTWFTARAEGRTAEIHIYDEIGLWGINAADFIRDLKGLGALDTINLRINSPGGSVFDGLAIHNSLKRHKARVVVTVDGIAASIASVVAMAGDEVVMPANALMMIHNPSGGVLGTSKDMRELANVLDKIKEGLISAYAERTGIDRDAIAELMDDETWLDPSEAVRMGFADRVEEPARIAAHFDLSKFRNAPAAKDSMRGTPAASTPASTEETLMSDANDPVTKPETTAGDINPAIEENAVVEAPAVEASTVEAVFVEPLTAKADPAEIAELCASANVATMAAVLIREGVTLDEAKARINSAGQIRDMVAKSGRISKAIEPKLADEFIAQGMSVEAARSEVFAKILAAQSPEVQPQVSASTNTRAGWDKAVTSINARFTK